MNRTLLQDLAEERAKEASSLLDDKFWSGAYYLAGYAVECGLKACVLAHVEKTGAIFRDRKFSEKCWTHDVEELVKLADLQGVLGIAIASSPALARNWAVVKDWNEASRYKKWSDAESRELYEAVTDHAEGVLAWIRGHW